MVRPHGPCLPCRLIHTPYELNFRVERDHTVLCTKELSGRELKKFRKVRTSKGPSVRHERAHVLARRHPWPSVASVASYPSSVW